jgi:adenylosuccinate synthase
MISFADVVCGLAWGDEAKGKITASLASSKMYDFVCRWAGGSNAGHTVYVDGKSYKTHVIPSGVFFGVKSLIGPGCVVHKEKFLQEIDYLSKSGFDTSLVKVSDRAHVVTDDHISRDMSELKEKLGTTGSGIAPCYADKAARVGKLSHECLPKRFIWSGNLHGNILCEGAQGVWLDIDWGNYPYVTSSVTLPYGACGLGIPPQKIRKIFGAAKMYDTRSGVDPLFPNSLLDDPVLAEIGEVGAEYGVTTGRRRKVNWLDLSLLVKAINMTGTTHLVMSKCDVLESVGKFCLFQDDLLMRFDSICDMRARICSIVESECELIEEIRFSHSPEFI